MCLSAPQYRGSFIIMHRYRTHTCGVLREGDIGKEVRLSGWCHRIRDHGGLLFIDLRDHYGLTQVVADPNSPSFKHAEKLRSEWVVRIDGKVRKRPAGTENPDLPTGAIEIYISEIEVLGPAGELPMPVFGDQEYPEDIRLTYRFLDLRRERLHRNIMMRGAVIELHQAAHEGARLFRVSDPDPDGLLARRRPRLSRAVAAPSGKILRAAAGAAAVQTTDHGVRLRSLLSDRALFPRRGCARRSFTRRVLSARPRDELRYPAGCVRSRRACHARRVRGILWRQDGHVEISTHPVQRCNAQVRNGQAGLAQPPRHCRRDRRVQ